MHRAWCRDDHMGHSQMSKQLAPSQFDEARNDPARTMAVLRAWALWRMRQSHEWLAAQPRRRRQLARDEAELERDVRVMPGTITGNREADVMLKRWAREVVERV